MSVKHKPKMLSKAESALCQTFPLTLDQRSFQRALLEARRWLPDLTLAVETEIAKLVNDVEFSIDLSLCNGTGLDGWLAEPGRLLLECPVLVPEDDHCYMALDFISVHHLADLCLGGQLTNQSGLEDKPELTASELRVSGRLLQRQAQAMQQLLFKEQSALPAFPVKQQLEPAVFCYIPFKVRLVLSDEAISWYLWLPKSFFLSVKEHAAVNPAAQPAVAIENWVTVPVKGRIEMARKKVSFQELQACVNGRILPIELSSAMHFQLDKQALFLGKVAEEDSALVFQITGLVNGE
ncbi:hypothetical protein QE250_09280 [Chromatiaceae bacterium AAb-1]|nr:hypothetical protein [Chromatiaceae bacterium AAb-1]